MLEPHPGGGGRRECAERGGPGLASPERPHADIEPLTYSKSGPGGGGHRGQPSRGKGRAQDGHCHAWLCDLGPVTVPRRPFPPGLWSAGLALTAGVSPGCGQGLSGRAYHLHHPRVLHRGNCHPLWVPSHPRSSQHGEYRPPPPPTSTQRSQPRPLRKAVGWKAPLPASCFFPRASNCEGLRSHAPPTLLHRASGTP